MTANYSTYSSNTAFPPYADSHHSTINHTTSQDLSIDYIHVSYTATPHIAITSTREHHILTQHYTHMGALCESGSSHTHEGDDVTHIRQESNHKEKGGQPQSYIRFTLPLQLNHGIRTTICTLHSLDSMPWCEAIITYDLKHKKRTLQSV